MTELEKWKAFLTEQGVGFVANSHNGITTNLFMPFLTVNLFLYLYILNEINLIGRLS